MFSEKDMTAATVTNLTDFDFTPDMGAMYNGKPFPLRKGETLTTNLTVAEHLSKHLAQQSLLRGSGKDDRSLWTPESLSALAGTFVKTIGQFEVPKAQTKEEILTSNLQQFQQTQPETIDVLKEKSATEFKDKAEVIAELKKRNIQFDARATKATLEAILKDSESEKTDEDEEDL